MAARQRLEVVGATLERVGELDIDVEDLYARVFRSEDGPSLCELALDYMSRQYRRGIEVVGTDATIRLDWARQVMSSKDRQDVLGTSRPPVMASYETQADRFLSG